MTLLLLIIFSSLISDMSMSSNSRCSFSPPATVQCSYGSVQTLLSASIGSALRANKLVINCNQFEEQEQLIEQGQLSHLSRLSELGSFSGLTSLSVLNLAENTLHSLPPECLAHSPVSIHSVLRETNLRTSMVLSQHRTSLNC